MDFVHPEIQQVHHLPAPGHQRLGDEPAMTPPPVPFGAEDGHRRFPGQGGQLGQPLLKGRGGHVIRIRRLGAPTQGLSQPCVTHARGLQTGLQSLLSEPGPAPGAGEAPHVHHHLHAGFPEQHDEVLQGTVGMPHREHRRHRRLPTARGPLRAPTYAPARPRPRAPRPPRRGNP